MGLMEYFPAKETVFGTCVYKGCFLSKIPAQEPEEKNVRNKPPIALAVTETRGRMKLIIREIVGKLVSVPR